MSQCLIDDALWSRIEPLLPKPPWRRWKTMRRPPSPIGPHRRASCSCCGVAAVANAPDGNGLWLGQHVLATTGAVATRCGLAPAARRAARRVAPAGPIGSHARLRRQGLRAGAALGNNLTSPPRDHTDRRGRLSDAAVHDRDRAGQLRLSEAPFRIFLSDTLFTKACPVANGGSSFSDLYLEGHRVGPASVLDDELIFPVLLRRDLNRTLRSG
jgi:hypothetical protein